MGSIGANPNIVTEVGIATSNGKAYYIITSFLKKIGVAYSDMVLVGDKFVNIDFRTFYSEKRDSGPRDNIRLIITTRKERLQLDSNNVICIEDLSEDTVVAKERLLSVLYPSKDGDSFIVGIDPGERTGVAAFINHREIESSVLSSLEEIVSRVTKLVDNAPSIRRIIRIGYGNPIKAVQLARILEKKYESRLKIQLVDERGTSTLGSRNNAKRGGTRDQRAAKLIAFREGFEFHSGPFASR